MKALKRYSEPFPAAGQEGAVSFADMLRRTLGEAEWRLLARGITARFEPRAGPGRPLVFAGIMQQVYCSPLGALAAILLRGAAILPPRCVQDVPFTFRITLQGRVLAKERCYQLDRKTAFVFRSVFSETPSLHEEFRGGLGMYLGVAAYRRCLLFFDRHYFLRIGRLRLLLPRWLGLGRFELIHRNMDDRRFQVLIRVSHPLFGTLFYQRGEFEQRA